MNDSELLFYYSHTRTKTTRIGVVKTHSDANSWNSRFPSSEHPLLPCPRAHFLRGDVDGNDFTTHLVFEVEKNTLPPYKKLLFFVRVQLSYELGANF
jgi:hypothetical protein